MLVALAVALPFLLLTTGIVWKLAENERQNQREAIVYSTRTLANAVDALLNKQIAIGRILAASPTLMADNLAEFRNEAERARPGLSGGWVLLVDEHGQQLINIARPPEQTLPLRNPNSIELQREARRTGEVKISHVRVGRFVQQPIITIEVPVTRSGKPPLGLAMIMDASAFAKLMDDRHLPESLDGRPDRPQWKFRRPVTRT